jgi:hypothetical protein
MRQCCKLLYLPTAKTIDGLFAISNYQAILYFELAILYQGEGCATAALTYPETHLSAVAIIPVADTLIDDRCILLMYDVTDALLKLTDVKQVILRLVLIEHTFVSL